MKYTWDGLGLGQDRAGTGILELGRIPPYQSKRGSGSRCKMRYYSNVLNHTTLETSGC